MSRRSSMGRRRAVSAEEHDAYSSWRQALCYLQRPGVVKSIKRSTHKRERREARNDLRQERS